MTEAVNDRTVDFSNEERTRVRAKGYEGAIRYGESGSYPGVDFIAWEFEGIDGKKCDGAMLSVKEESPPQVVESETTFSEVPLNGDLIILTVNPKNEVAAYRFRGDNKKDRSYMFEVGKDWIMMLHNVAGKENPSEVLEYEEPGFSQSKLTNIEIGQEEINGRPIPKEYWQLLDQIKSGQLENTVVPIVNLSDI
jgi:hypothetical protein